MTDKVKVSANTSLQFRADSCLALDYRLGQHGITACIAAIIQIDTLEADGIFELRPTLAASVMALGEIMKKRLGVKAAIGTAVVAFGLLGTGLAPAQAAATDCSPGFYCVWKDQNYTNTRYSYNSTTVPGPIGSLSISSVYNRKAYNVRNWDQANYTGNSIAVGSGTAYNSLSAFNRYAFATWNDSINSFLQSAA